MQEGISSMSGAGKVFHVQKNETGFQFQTYMQKIINNELNT